MFKYQLEIKSDFDLDTVRDRIITILRKREYADIKVFDNIISFDNGFTHGQYFSTPIKVRKGTFKLNTENDSVTVQFTYKILSPDILLGFFAIAAFGFFINYKFFYLLAVGIVGWTIGYIILRLEAQELIAVCKKQIKSW